MRETEVEEEGVLVLVLNTHYFVIRAPYSCNPRFQEALPILNHHVRQETDVNGLLDDLISVIEEAELSVRLIFIIFLKLMVSLIHCTTLPEWCHIARH